jgi:hypothetical protein
LTTVVQEVGDGNEHQPERGEDQNEGGCRMSRHSLPLTAGQLVREPPGTIGQTELIQCTQSGGAGLSSR